MSDQVYWQTQWDRSGRPYGRRTGCSRGAAQTVAILRPGDTPPNKELDTLREELEVSRVPNLRTLLREDVKKLRSKEYNGGEGQPGFDISKLDVARGDAEVQSEAPKCARTQYLGRGPKHPGELQGELQDVCAWGLLSAHARGRKAWAEEAEAKDVLCALRFHECDQPPGKHLFQGGLHRRCGKHEQLPLIDRYSTPPRNDDQSIHPRPLHLRGRHAKRQMDLSSSSPCG